MAGTKARIACQGCMMPEPEMPRLHKSALGDGFDAGKEAIKTVAGLKHEQALILIAIGLTAFICIGGVFFGNMVIQGQKEIAHQTQDSQHESFSLLSRTIESEGEKNRSNTSLVVGSMQSIAITLGKLQVTLTNLETRLAKLEEKISKLAPPEHEMSTTAPMPRRKVGQVHQ